MSKKMFAHSTILTNSMILVLVWEFYDFIQDLHQLHQALL